MIAMRRAAPKIDRWYYKGTEDNKFYEWSDVDSKHSECIGIWDIVNGSMYISCRDEKGTLNKIRMDKFQFFLKKYR